MRIVAFIEARQQEVIRKILEHCGLWEDPPARSPLRVTRPSQPGEHLPDPDSRRTYEVDPDFLESARRDQQDQPELPWEP